MGIIIIITVEIVELEVVDAVAVVVVVVEVKFVGWLVLRHVNSCWIIRGRRH